jgi:hypothetical protein
MSDLRQILNLSGSQHSVEWYYCTKLSGSSTVTTLSWAECRHVPVNLCWLSPGSCILPSILHSWPDLESEAPGSRDKITVIPSQSSGAAKVLQIHPVSLLPALFPTTALSSDCNTLSVWIAVSPPTTDCTAPAWNPP